MVRESGALLIRLPITGELAAQRRAIETRLAELAPAAARGDRLSAAMRYGLLAPGKRLRPLLVLGTVAHCAGRSEGVLDTACAVEMIHAASLIIDDLPAMDDADLRRGQPATHKAFGEDIALLASIALLSAAQRTVAGLAGVDPQIRCRLMTVLAEASGCEGLSKGQMFDLCVDQRSGVGDIEQLNHYKTSVLFAAAVEAAAVLCEAAPPVRERLRQFALHFGHAFQLADDLDDGPLTGNGEDGSRRTSIQVLGTRRVRQEFERHVAQAKAYVGPDSPLAAFVSALGRHADPAAGAMPSRQPASVVHE